MSGGSLKYLKVNCARAHWSSQSGVAKSGLLYLNYVLTTYVTTLRTL